jgi:hypothetical protein
VTVIIWLAPLVLLVLILGAIGLLREGYSDLAALEQDNARRRQRLAERSGGYTGGGPASEMRPPRDVATGAMRECPRCGLLVSIGQRWCDGSGDHK